MYFTIHFWIMEMKLNWSWELGEHHDHDYDNCEFSRSWYKRIFHLDIRLPRFSKLSLWFASNFFFSPGHVIFYRSRACTACTRTLQSTSQTSSRFALTDASSWQPVYERWVQTTQRSKCCRGWGLHGWVDSEYIFQDVHYSDGIE